MTIKLYDYWRSSAAYRVRIALNLKGLAYEQISVHLVADGGAQHKADFRALNPNGTVPTLVLDDGSILNQSLAIIEYLDGSAAEPPLLPDDPVARAKVRSAAQIVICDIHPINNLRVLQRLGDPMGHGKDDVAGWVNHWMAHGLAAYQASIDADTPFSFGDRPTLADICLVPQMYNAERWKLDMSGLERVQSITARCLQLDAFANARPEVQPDAE
jgi:maleylacetoacetate isomerase